ncbi:YczE/YyaS/YitT family protein [Mycoplasma sp. P36-A1]|uniref:YczE/YyaS/YitT family protein n=1 Tax=Mycoplasma sp. P36-A1 TaxID=3252900 RepID=UPI003C2FC3C0
MNFKWESNILLRMFYSLIGSVLLALGASVLLVGNAGLDPFTSLNMSLGVNVLNMNIGDFQLLLNSLILVLMYVYRKDLIGYGTLISLVIVGYLISFFSTTYFQYFNFEPSLFLSFLYLVVGIILYTLGISLYMAPLLGNSPYDAITPIIVDKFKIPYKYSRIIQDSVFVILSIVFGGFNLGYVGVATIINAFFVGPLIVFWNEKISYPLVWKNSVNITNLKLKKITLKKF